MEKILRSSTLERGDIWWIQDSWQPYTNCTQECPTVDGRLEACALKDSVHILYGGNVAVMVPPEVIHDVVPPFVQNILMFS